MLPQKRSSKISKLSADFLRTLDRQIVIGNIFAMLLGAITCVKHEGFHEERNASGEQSTLRNVQSPL